MLSDVDSSDDQNDGCRDRGGSLIDVEEIL